MPKYAYKCKECDHAFEAVHGMFMKLRNCDECGTDGSLFRIPSTSFTANMPSKDDKPGQIVKDFIEEAREEVQKEKERMKEGLDK
jgi:putative FmdB family regulatory protein